MKIVMLIPCLMLPNNRKANQRAMRYAKEFYTGIDEFVVNDQEFLESDYEEGFTYIGHHKERQGFVNTRNQLLEWFYNSDADWAVWMDANAIVSKPTLNDFITLVDAAKDGRLEEVDAIFATLGLMVSGERIELKKRDDYFDAIYLINQTAKNSIVYDTMHSLFLVNLKKRYGQEIYIDKRCDPHKGTSEDIYFARILRQLFNTRLCPTLTISKPTNKASTWVSGKRGYDYPKADFKTIDTYIQENIKEKYHASHIENRKTYKLYRSTRYKGLLKPYKPKAKVKANILK